MFLLYAMSLNRIRLAEVLVVVGAIVARVVAMMSLQSTAYERHPLVDAHTYWAQATSLAKGVDPFRDGYYQPRAIQCFFVLVAGMVWARTLGSPYPSVGFGGITTLVLIPGTAIGGAERRWFGWVAGALYAFYPSTILFELDLLTPAVTGFVSVFLLVLVTPNAPAWRFAVAGVFGRLGIVFPSIVLVVVLALMMVACVAELASKSAMWCAVLGTFFGAYAHHPIQHRQV